MINRDKSTITEFLSSKNSVSNIAFRERDETKNNTSLKPGK